MSDNLISFYNNLKDSLNTKNTNDVLDNSTCQNKTIVLSKERDKLVNGCCKRILLDIYCKILPLDDDYKIGHQGAMKSDIDNLLQNRNTTASEYIKSAYENTSAPLLDFILHSTNLIGNQFIKEANEKIKDAEENDIDLPTPKSDVNSEEIEDQLIDIKKDTEYETFIDKLKRKTVDKIVSDVSKLINDKKEEKQMTFDLKNDNVNESVVVTSLDYMNSKLWKENVNIDNKLHEDMLGFAIREATLHEIDKIFKQPYSSNKDMRSKIIFGKGNIVNESAISYIKENAVQTTSQQRFEPLYKEIDGNKYDIANYEKINKDGTKNKMNDQEAKKVLDPNGYNNYKNKK